MKLLQFSLLAASIVFGVVSCGSEDDTTGPVITISKPASGQEFRYGGNLTYSLLIEDEGGVSKFEYEIIPVSSESETLSLKKEFFFDSFYSYIDDTKSISLPAEVNTTTKYADEDYIFRITAVDFYNNVSHKDVNIRIINPDGTTR